ncbi:MAG: FHA domain-containing protein [Thermoanaerobaculia bacterium]|nr:FHA domain-containing protein [Thermoanaerobaculia bacterium]
MLELQFVVNGEQKVVSLDQDEIRFGRSGENEVVLPDYSVSRRHARVVRDGDRWWVEDLKSTNGVQLNGQSVQRAEIRFGDDLKMGVFELQVAGTAGRSDAPGLGAVHANLPISPGMDAGPTVEAPSPAESAAISNATIVRSLRDFSAEYGLDGMVGVARDASAVRQSKRQALDEAYASHVFGFLTRLARLLITTDSDDEILRHVLDIAFEVFPVDRGFLLLKDDSGELQCEVMRLSDETKFRPTEDVPISKTMLQAVMNERVALLTYDALSDQRLAGTESVRIHQIRAAMCAPLWSGEKIIGVMQLDTPHHTGTFTEPDVDLLATLSNYCAVAIERNRNARDAEFQREVRNRLSRYHSPAVIEQVMHEDSSPDVERVKVQRAEVTVLFADIVGFTATSENSQPEEVAKLMEGYFTYAVEAIFSFGGTLDKFIGDCVMAFFGAPMPQEDHAYRAVAAAVKVREALEQWNAQRDADGLPRVKTRVAINSGPVVVGDIGSNRRVDYTVLGNTVNVAARLEEMVAEPGDIVLGEETHRQLAGSIPCESLGDFQLKGLSRKIAAYRVR